MTPVLMPIIKQAGIDPVYFGVLFIINNSIGLITPPVGTVLNVICGVSKLKMEDLMRGVMPFLIAELIVLFLLVLVPATGDRAGLLVRAIGTSNTCKVQPAGGRTRPNLGGKHVQQTDEIGARARRAGSADGSEPGAGRDPRAPAQVRRRQQQGPSPGDGHGEVRRTGEGKERRQDRGQAVSRAACSAATCRPSRRCRAA